VAAAAGAALALAACGGSDSPSESQATAAAPAPRTVDWPFFGRDTERTHFLADAPQPPFHFLWQFFAHQLIEFPPALAGGQLYVVNKTGEVYAIRASDAKVLWKRNLDNDVSGPAYADGAVYLAQYDGDFVALDARNGKELWHFDPTGHLESSPLVVDGTVFFGDDSGLLYALDDQTGKLKWKVHAGPDIKASPSFHDGVVYVGDYAGGIRAVSAASGHQLWNVDTTKLPPGGDGGFYASPTIAFGHVYEGRDDGAMYAVTLAGKPSWNFKAGDGIYGSAAAADVPGAGPTVFVGSYDHMLYAFGADNGAKRWTYNVGGQIPGSPTVIGKTVYTSSFQANKTVGLSASDGKPTFHWGSAGYDPMISDGQQVFLTGYQTVWAFEGK
jgi:outer membrane protein assembly factor BamB